MRALEILLIGMSVAYMVAALLAWLVPLYAAMICGVLAIAAFVVAMRVLNKSIEEHPTRLGRPPIDRFNRFNPRDN